MVRSWLSLCFLMLLGCGARSGVRDIDTTTGTPCNRVANAFCSRLGVCGPESLVNGLTGGRAVGPDRCVARVTLACEGWNATPDLAATPGQIEACRVEVLQQTCGQIVYEYFEDGPFCAAWPVGRRADGMPCQLGAQCAGGSCSFRADRGCGTCRSFPRPAAQGPGEPCDEARRCHDQQRCINAVCVDPRGPDESCTGNECNPDRGLVCQSESMRCVPRPVSPPGGACLSGTDRASAMCEVLHNCGNRNDFGQGRCQRLIADGEPCAAFSAECEYPARCQAERCTLPSLLVCQ